MAAARVMVVLAMLLSVSAGNAAMAQQSADASTAAPIGAGAPDILRGSVAPPPRVEPSAGAEGRVVAAGERIWFVDRSAKRLTGCRLINTIEVDGQAIRCTERRLPRGAAWRD
jgi:hypothetical protein